MSELASQKPQSVRLQLGLMRDHGGDENIFSLLSQLESSSDKIFEAALHSTNGSCMGCGFKPANPRHLCLHHVDLNYTNHAVENLTTLCSFCKAPFHLKLAGKNKGARLVYWPDISQAQMNRALRALFCARDLQLDDSALIGKRVFEGLSKRALVCEETWGTSDPLIFAAAFSQIGPSLDSFLDKTNALRLVLFPSSPFVVREQMNSYTSQMKENFQNKRREDVLYSLVLRQD